VQHAQWVIAALDAGKHVLCEKPLAMNAAEVRTMMAAAERNNRLLVEAVWTRWQPRMKRMAEVVQRGDLGDVSSVASAFTFQGDLTGNYRSLPEFGGGALLDVGCYQVHLWMMLLNEAITFHISDIERTMSAEGIDLTTNIQALVNDVVSVNASCSFDLPPAQSIRVTGTQTTMRTGDGEAFTLWKQPATLLIGDNVEHFPADDAFALMVESMSTNIREGTTPLFPMASSLRVAEILDEIRTFQPEK
jgi:predicted dehydrogenase